MTAQHYLAGEWADGSPLEAHEVVNPATGERVGRIPLGTRVEVDVAVAAAKRALPTWSATPMADRIRTMQRLAEGITARREDLAQTLTFEMGSPITFSRQAQVGVAIADIKELIRAAEQHESERSMSRSLVVTEPAGVVAAITPWNFPLHQIVLKVGAALLAGCTLVLKPSEVAPLSATIFAEIIHELGLPSGTFNLVHGDGVGVGVPLVDHDDVDMVTFTGSREVGEHIARTASRTIKKVSLELGGKSAAIILDDADLESSVQHVLRSAFANAGQTCAAMTRVLVPHGLKAEWERLALDEVARWQPGSPAEEGTVLGPVASLRQRDRIAGHIETALSEGAILLAGGVPDVHSQGAWVYPTVFTDVTPQMSLFHEEVFGPVLAITGYDTEDDAVRLANDSKYGLSGGVWSQDEARALRVALNVRTGTIGINGEGLDVGAPFGGMKQSGIGRECGSYGLEEFFEVKSVMGAAHLRSREG